MVQMDNSNVQLVIDGPGRDRQHQFFQCCHIGMVFFSENPIEDYSQMEFNLSFLEESESDLPLNCKGVVVDSSYEEERGMYKTFFLYTDIDSRTKDRLKAISKEKELRCPFCLRS